MQRALLACVACFFVSCGRLSPTTVSVSRQTAPTDVGWLTLTRDQTTASRYTGIRVRVRLNPEDYEVGVKELRVWADGRSMGRPPILLFQCADQVQVPAKSRLLVVGVCTGPTIDGIPRTRTADYCVNVVDCAITVLPGP